MVCDWLTKLMPLSQPMGISKPKPIVFSLPAFSCTWNQLHVFASNFDWLIVLFASVAIGQSNYFGFGFTTLNWKPLYDQNTVIGIDCLLVWTAMF